MSRSNSLSTFHVIALLAVHIPLALIIGRFPFVGTVHSLLALGCGFAWAAQGRDHERLGYVAAYIAGAEVTWRMAGAPIFYEFGKYAASAIFIVSLLKTGRLRSPGLAFFYLALLLPSAGVTFTTLDFSQARNQVSFNMSGPFALAIAAWFFWRQELTASHRRRLFITLLAPILGLAAVALSSTLTASEIAFSGTESNFVTSGGFGPNQVSAVLGLGAVVAFYLAVDGGVPAALRALMFGLMLLLGAQSALTFSRGGLYAAAGAVGAALIFLAGNRHSRWRLAGVVGLAIAVGYFFIVPYLNAFTGGALVDRFRNTDPTMRDDLIQEDLDVWRDNLLMGVGPGGAMYSYTAVTVVPGIPKFQSTARREERLANSHTEFSRLLAEHGCLGLAAIALLVVTAISNLRRTMSLETRALAAGLTAWSVLYMMSAAMRLLAPSFLFALPCATLLPESDERPVRASAPQRPLADGRFARVDLPNVGLSS